MKINLSRNSWHRRLQRYVLQIPVSKSEDFPNLCPYFWLTVFCIFASPFVLFWRNPVQWVGQAIWLLVSTIHTVCEAVADALAYPLKKLVCIPLEKWYINSYIMNLDGDDVLEYYEASHYSGYRKKRKFKIFRKWQEAHIDNWHDLITKFEKEALERKRARDEKLYADYLRQVASEQGNVRQWLTGLATKTQKVAPFGIGILAIGAAYLLYLAGCGIYHVLTLIPWGIVWHYVCIGAYWTGIVALGAASVFIVICIVSLFYKQVFSTCWVALCFPFKTKVVGKMWRGMGKPIVWFGDRIFDGYELFEQYFKASKENYCPKIEWKDE